MLAGYLQRLENDASHAALIVDDNVFSYSEPGSCVSALSETIGHRQNLRIAIALPNSIDVACWYIASVLSRSTLILMDHSWLPATRDAALQLLEPQVMVTDRGVTLLESIDPLDASEACIANAESAAGADWYAADSFAFLVGFTSGSSGNPRAFLRYSDSWLESFECSTREFEVDSETVQFAPGPLSHGLSSVSYTHLTLPTKA